MWFRVLLLFGATGLATQGCAPPAFRIDELASPAIAPSLAPSLTTEGKRAILSWIEIGDSPSLEVSVLSPSGWSAPLTAVADPDLMVNSADVPSVLELGDGTLVAAWGKANGPDPEAYDLRLAWSRDSGHTWSDPVSPHHDGTQTQHGFASLFRAPEGGVGLVWLDGRAMTIGSDSAGPAGAMALRTSSFGTDRIQGPEAVVDPRVCECCPVATAVTGTSVVVAFRDRSEAEVRDISVARLVDGRWTPPTPVHVDGWTITGCPVNGPSISARGQGVAVAWFTIQQGLGRTFVAFSDDVGQAFGQPILVDDEGSLGRAEVALLSDGTAAVSWVEVSDGRSHLRLRRIRRDGVRSAAVTVAQGMGARRPRLARHGSGVLLAWVEAEGVSTRVRTAVAN